MSNNTLQIITIDDALAGLRDGTQTVQQIGEYLGGMWQDAVDRADQTAVEYYQAAWDLANALGASNDQARHLIQAVGAERDHAIAQRDEVTGQRDQVAAAYHDYQTAVINMDTEHPEAGRHIKLVHSKGKLDGRDEGLSEGYNEGYDEGISDSIDGEVWEIISNDPASDFLNAFLSDFSEKSDALDMLAVQASDFVMMLFEEDTEVYSLDLRRQAMALMAQIHPQVLAEKTAYEIKARAEQRERETRWEAERAARLAARTVVSMTDHLTEDSDDYDDENTDPDA